jgi:hypothetical protein
MFDTATEKALDQRLKDLGVESVKYRSLLVGSIKAEKQEYDLDAARKRALALRKSTYRRMRKQAMAVGFSQQFAITLADMAMNANLHPPGDRVDLYLYMMKSTAKKGLRTITDAQLDERDVYEVTTVVASHTFRFRVYGNLTDKGVALVRAHARDLENIEGVVRYKVAKPGSRWRRDTMVIYCTTREGADGALAWFGELQRGVDDPATYFAADVPHFTEPEEGLRGVSSVEDRDPSATSSYSEGMAVMVRTAIDAGAARFDEANPIASYVDEIVARLDTFWTNPISMRGKPRP